MRDEELYETEVLRLNTLTDAQRSLISTIALQAESKPYDYLFNPGLNAFYCSELVDFSYRSALKDQTLIPWKIRKVWGADSIYPQDLLEASIGSTEFISVWRDKFGNPY